MPGSDDISVYDFAPETLLSCLACIEFKVKVNDAFISNFFFNTNIASRPYLTGGDVAATVAATWATLETKKWLALSPKKKKSNMFEFPATPRRPSWSPGDVAATSRRLESPPSRQLVSRP